MKRFGMILSLLLAVAMMVTLLAGCGGITAQDLKDQIGALKGDTAEEPAPADGDEEIAGEPVDDGDYITPDYTGYAEGFLGDTLRTSWFDFTVNDAYLCDEYEGYVAAEGNELLVADLTIYNYGTYSVPMYDTDFELLWYDADNEFCYAFPVTCPVDEGDEAVEPVGDMLPGEYTLGIHRTMEGVHVYEIPAGSSDFSIGFQEYFEDETEGDVFFVYFTAYQQ